MLRKLQKERPRKRPKQQKRKSRRKTKMGSDEPAHIRRANRIQRSNMFTRQATRILKKNIIFIRKKFIIWQNGEFGQTQTNTVILLFLQSSLSPFTDEIALNFSRNTVTHSNNFAGQRIVKFKI